MIFNFFKKNKGDFVYSELKVVGSRSEIPENIKDTIFLVSNEGANKWLILNCPGGHNRLLEVNLMENKKPYWRVSLWKGKISVQPSIAVMEDSCDCHFWLRGNIAYKARFMY
jgi:hypothetical protein